MFKKESFLAVRTHLKPTETFQYTHFTSCHPPGVSEGFIKGEPTPQKLHLKKTLPAQFKRRLRDRAGQDNLL